MGFINAVWDFMWVAIFCFVGYWATTLSDNWQVDALYAVMVVVLFALVAIKAYKGHYK